MILDFSIHSYKLTFFLIQLNLWLFKVCIVKQNYLLFSLSNIFN